MVLSLNYGTPSVEQTTHGDTLYVSEISWWYLTMGYEQHNYKTSTPLLCSSSIQLWDDEKFQCKRPKTFVQMSSWPRGLKQIKQENMFIIIKDLTLKCIRIKQTWNSCKDNTRCDERRNHKCVIIKITWFQFLKKGS